MTVRLFISHTSTDAALARGFVEFIHAVIPIDAREIRCTSNPGTKLGPGVQVSKALRQELESTSAVIVLLTSASLHSGWVLFELGAAWGMQRWVAPVRFGIDIDQLPGPLKEVNAPDGFDHEDLQQLAEAIAEKLGTRLQPPGQVAKGVTKLIEVIDEWQGEQDDEPDDDEDEESELSWEETRFLVLLSKAPSADLTLLLESEGLDVPAGKNARVAEVATYFEDDPTSALSWLFSKDKLQALCDQFGCPRSGNKDELAERLMDPEYDGYE